MRSPLENAARGLVVADDGRCAGSPHGSSSTAKYVGLTSPSKPNGRLGTMARRRRRTAVHGECGAARHHCAPETRHNRNCPGPVCLGSCASSATFTTATNKEAAPQPLRSRRPPAPIVPSSPSHVLASKRGRCCARKSLFGLLLQEHSSGCEALQVVRRLARTSCTPLLCATYFPIPSIYEHCRAHPIA
jgi:hypothetical protein